MYIDRTLTSVESNTPHQIQKTVPREELAAMPDEKAKQLRFSGCQRNGLTRARRAYASCCAFDAHIGKPYRLIDVLLVDAEQELFYSGSKFSADLFDKHKVIDERGPLRLIQVFLCQDAKSGRSWGIVAPDGVTESVDLIQQQAVFSVRQVYDK